MISLCPLGPLLLPPNPRRHVNHFPCSIDKGDAETHSLQVQNLSVHAGMRTTSTGASISFISTKCGYADGFREGR